VTIATIIPAYNEPADRVLAAVESARAVSDFVVVADDGSRDAIACPGAVVTRDINKGPAAAMNRGVAVALAEGATRIMRLDVGDRFCSEARLRQLATPGHAMCSWHLDLVEGKIFRPLEWWRRQIYWDGAFCICTVVVTADAWREVGGFDESLRYGDDWDFAMRVEHAIGWTMHPEVTCEAGAFEGGHTKGADTDPIKRQRKHDDSMRVRQRGIDLRKRR
jgi:glycosyltransferase involved in cell wall biosynthesis